MVDGLIFTSMQNSIGVAKTIGPYLIASELRRKGISCQVINYFNCLSIDEVKKIAEKFVSNTTKFIGFSSTFFFNYGGEYFYTDFHNLFTHTKEYMLQFFKIFKTINPDILFIYGGKYVDFMSHYNHKYIDLYISGPGEQFMVQLLKNSVNPIGKFVDCRAYRHKPLKNFIDCDIFQNKLSGELINSVRLIDNFENTPMVWDKTDIIDKNEHLPLETSRGCIFNCAYCRHRLFNPYKEKNLDVLKYELENNYNKFGIHNYIITDNSIDVVYKSTVEKLKVMVDLPFNISFSCFARLPSFMKHPDLREKFLEAGCKYIHFGLVSFNNKSLKAVQKDAKIEEQIETLHYLKDLWKDKVRMTSGFIVGLPYDNRKTIEKWVKYLRGDQSPLYESHIQPLSIDNNGNKFMSHLSMNPEKYGYIITNDTNKWISTTSDMTRKIAEDICTRDSTNKKPFWHLASHLMNLGYKKDELKQINIYNSSFKCNLEKRKLESKNNYIQKVLKGS